MNKKRPRIIRRFLLWLSQKSMTFLTAMLGVFFTLFITSIHCIAVTIIYGNIEVQDIIRPLGYGAILTPFMVYIFSQVFDEIAQSKNQVIDMRIQESKLKDSLSKTYLAMINQRHRNTALSQDQEKLKGSLIEEISKKIAAQNQLDDQTGFFHAAVNLTPDIILYRNLSGKILGVNQNLLDLLNVNSQEELEHKILFDAELCKSFTYNDEIIINNKQDIVYNCEINNVVLQMRKKPVTNSKNSIIGIMCYGQDITKLKNEQDILEKASRDKSVFISTLSHELRTPLNGIVGLSDILLRTGKFKGEEEKSLQAINVSAVTLGNIFNDIIDLNKFERNTFSLAPESIKWLDFINDIKTLFKLMAKQKGLEFNYKTIGTCYEYLFFDGIRLRQILWNIIANAIKFTQKGSVNLSITMQNIDNTKAKLKIEISDTGIGISKEHQDKIFELYYQVAGCCQSTGTGIGLHVAKSLCDVMNGTITLQSEINKGSTFILEFTFEKGEKQTHKDISAHKKLNILLVEDVDLNIFVAKKMLENFGHNVIVSKTGKDAILKFKDNIVDLVLLDMKLPDITGTEVADRLHNEEGCTVPIIALTANVINEFEQYSSHNIIDVISKPLSISKLQDLLIKYFSEE
ncbi:MAG: ATP-binding protein [Succinivibrionaceae bacterium]